jgi:hypothetical protein
MFSKVLPKIKQFYFLPLAFTVPAKAFTEGYEEYIKCKNDKCDEELPQYYFDELYGFCSKCRYNNETIKSNL